MNVKHDKIEAILADPWHDKSATRRKQVTMKSMNEGRTKPTHTPRRNFRVSDELWTAFSEAAVKLGAADASDRIRQHMEADVKKAAKR